MESPIVIFSGTYGIATFSETLTKTLTKFKGYKSIIPEWNAEHGDSNEWRYSTGSFETGFKTIHCTLLELEP